MSKGPAIAVTDHADVGSVQIALSAVVVGTVHLGECALVAEGAVIRASGTGVEIGTGSAVLENSVIVGNAEVPNTVGRRTTFGHRCVVIGATVGDLCEIGNASILMSGARVGDRVFLGEGTLVPARLTLPSDVVAVGDPHASPTPPRATTLNGSEDCATETSRSHRPRPSPSNPQRRAPSWASSTPTGASVPTIAESAVLFPSAEVTGDVVVGERTIIGAGVKIR